MVHDRKKTRKRGLTASRRKRPVFPRDELDGRLRKIEMLASLMAASRPDELWPEMVGRAGAFILDEVEGIKGLLEQAETLP